MIVAPFLAGAVVGVTTFSAVASATGAAMAGGVGATVLASLATAVTAGLLDAAYQGVAVATGLQSKFSWKEMLTMTMNAGIASAVTPGFVDTILKGSGLTVTQISEQLMRVATTSVLQQLGELAAGITQKFDVDSILTSLASTLVDLGVDTKLGNSYVAAAAEGVTDTLVGSAIEGHIEIENLAAQMLGTAIGDEVNTKINNLVEAKANAEANDQLLSSIDMRNAPSPFDDFVSQADFVEANSSSFWKTPSPATSTTTDSAREDRASRWGANSDSAQTTQSEVEANDVTPSSVASAYMLPISTDDFTQPGEPASNEVNQSEGFSLGGLLEDVRDDVKLVLTGAEMLGLIDENDSIDLSASAGYGLAVDVDLSISPDDVSIFLGAGAGFGLQWSVGTSKEFNAGTNGFAGKFFDVTAQLGPLPVVGEISGLINGDTGIGIEYGVKRGEGFMVESVVGYKKSIPW